MNKKLDSEIKNHFKNDTYIPESTRLKITETIEKNRTITLNKKEKFKIKNLATVFSLFFVLFLSANVYAYSAGLPNIFSSIIASLNIDTQVYDEEKIVVEEDSNLKNTNQKLLLKDYAYNNEVLIVNFVYTADNNSYKNFILMEDIFPLLAIYEGRTQKEIEEAGEGGCVPSYIITSKSSYIQNNEYAITKIYNMKELFIKDNKINLTIESILNETTEEILNETFILDIDNNKKSDFKTYTLDSNIIELNLDKIGKELDLWEFSKTEFEIINIVECELLTLVEILSNFDLGILEEKYEDGSATYISPSYTFEITDENGKILNSRNNQILALNMDSKLETLIIDSLKDSNVLNIKVYEEETNTLIGETQFNIKK